MKAKFTDTITIFLSRLLFIGLSVQIVMGYFWAFGAVAKIVPAWDMSSYFVAANKFAGNGDIGILYPALFVVARFASSGGFLTWYIFLYIFQMILAAVAGYFLIKEAGMFDGKKRMCVWASLAIMSFAPIMQINLSVTVNSLILSLLMLEAAMTIRFWKNLCTKKDGRPENRLYELSSVALFWLLLSLTKWMYLVIAAIPVLACMIGLMGIYGKKKDRKTVFFSVAVVFIFLGLILGLDNLTTDKENSVREDIYIDRVMFPRMVWKSRFYRPDSWLHEIGDVVGDDVMQQVAVQQGYVKDILVPALEEELGTDGALEVMRFSNNFVWEYDRREFLHDLIIDTGGYVIPPVMIQATLEKTTYITYTPRNYDMFARRYPMVSKFYMDYSLYLFDAAIAIMVIVLLLKLLGKKKVISKAEAIPYSILTVVCLMIVVRNVLMGSSMYNYCEAGSAMVAWYMAMMSICGKEMK